MSGHPKKNPPAQAANQGTQKSASTLDAETKKLAACAYGEASPDDVPEEMAGIAWAIANRARAWGNKSIDFMTKAEGSQYIKAVGNTRYKKLMEAGDKEIEANKGMQIAVEAAKNALANSGNDPSNGGFWWDGKDIKTYYKKHDKVRKGIRFTDPSHDIYGVGDNKVLGVKFITTYNKKTKKHVKQELGRYDYVYDSTAAHGGTIFWKYNEDYLKASRGKAYR